MLHLILDERPWFRPKSHGFGAGLPIAWQGWALIGAHVALIAGVSALLHRDPMAMAAAVIAVALLPLPIYARKTEGGWRWRWGK